MCRRSVDDAGLYSLRKNPLGMGNVYIADYINNVFERYTDVLEAKQQSEKIGLKEKILCHYRWFI